MSAFVLYILTALALILVIEGLFYALFTENVRKMMALALTLPAEKLRIWGFIVAASGFLLLMILQKLS